MTIARVCEGCGNLIKPPHFLDVGIRVERTDGGQSQDAIEEWWGDYCLACVQSGRAVADLLKAFTKVKLAARGKR